MNAQTPQVQVTVAATTTTLQTDKVAKLLGSVISKLITGDRQGHFYESLRRWDRGENPFISFTRICTNQTVPDEDKNVALLREVDKLIAIGFEIDRTLIELFEDIFSYSRISTYLPSVRGNGEGEVVTVRITDILKTEEQRKTFTYEQFLELAAEDFDLYPCDLFNGLRATLELGTKEQCGSYFIGLPTPLMTREGDIQIPYTEIRRRGPGGMVGPIYKTIHPQIIDYRFNPNTAHINSVHTLAFGHINPNEKKIIMVK